MRLLDMNPQKAEKDEDKNMWINVILDTKMYEVWATKCISKGKEASLFFLAIQCSISFSMYDRVSGNRKAVFVVVMTNFCRWNQLRLWRLV